MHGAPAPEYVQARRVLLDALEVLDAHLPGLVLVGAQAVYLHTGTATIAVPEYTTDADMAVAPDLIADRPLMGDALNEAGFRPGSDPGRWISPEGVYLDLLVPESLAGPGRRGADLGVHGRRTARRAHGLEAALVDRHKVTISALDPDDPRTSGLSVAGPAALLVAKLIKIDERTGATGRAVDKDALDIFRLLAVVPTEDLAAGLNRLRSHELAAATTREAIEALPRLFGTLESDGTLMAVRATAPLEDANVLAASIIALTGDLLADLTD